MIIPGVVAVQSGGSSYTGPLDLVSANIVGAYSQRALAAAWTDPVIRLRRVSDDTEQNFSPTVGNAISIAAVATFLGGSLELFDAQVVSGGTGYAANDNFDVTLVGGTHTTAAIVNVGTDGDGIVNNANSITNAGAYTAASSDPTAVTGGTGTGLTLRCAFGGNIFGTTWFDQSGGARDMTQATAGDQPRWTLTGDMAKLSRVDANGLVQTASDAITWNVGDPATFFVVLVYSPSNHSFAFSVESGNNYFELAGDGTAPYSGIQTDPGGQYTEWQNDAYPSQGVPHILEFVYDTLGNATMLIDGVVQSLSEVGGSGVIPLPALVGRIRSSFSTFPSATIECLLYRAALSSGNRTLIRQNIATYYGITLS